MHLHPDDFGEVATMNDAHREWHRNTGVPMGQPGCPQDACDPYHGDYDDADEQYERERTAVRALPAPQVAAVLTDPPF